MYCIQVHGQNLVTNPGFELYNNCPTDRGEILISPGYDSFYTAIDWVNPVNSTPDYFNRCGTDSSVKLPYLNLDGFHEPHSGNACAGISMFSGDPVNDTSDYWSEYLQTRLFYPLQGDHTYYISFYVCLTYHDTTEFNIISVDHIGARLTNEKIDTICQNPMFFMSGNEDIETPPGFFVTDTKNWTLISGIYAAKGGEQWLTIGRFFTDDLSYILLYKGYAPVSNNSVCYMLVDDICVIDMEHPLGTDTEIYSPQFPISIGSGKPTGRYLWPGGDTSAQIQATAAGVYTRQRWSDCAYYIDTFKVAAMPVDNCLWLPSAFTPNNDGLNDYFGPGNNFCQPDFASFSFSIYNRWGQKVFQSYSPGEKWDGTFNGKLAETGNYYYILQYSYGSTFSSLNNSPATAPKIIKGDVTLIR